METGKISSQVGPRELENQMEEDANVPTKNESKMASFPSFRTKNNETLDKMKKI